jgi:hypothetical protein
MPSGDDESKRRIAAFLASLAWFCSPIPLLMAVLTVHQGGQNLPFFDQWETSTDIALGSVSGSLQLRDLFVQHMEHRIVFTNLVDALLARYADWNLVLGMYFNIALACANLLWVLALTRLHGIRVSGPVVLLLSALVLSATQRWTWGFLSQWYFMIFFLLAQLWVLKRYPPGWGPLAVAAVCSLCGTYSFGAGMLSWLVVPPVLWGLGYRRWSYYAFWAACAGATALSFFWSYRFYTERRVGPGSILQFELALLGSPFAHRWSSPLRIFGVGALGLGLLGANATTLWSKRRDASQLSIWLGLALFVVAAGAIGAWGRIDLGVRFALSARYVPLATLFWLSVLALGLATGSALRENRSGGTTPLEVANGAALLLLVFLYLDASRVALRSSFPPTLTQVECVRAFPESRNADCLKGMHTRMTKPNLDDTDQRWFFDKIDRLHRHRLALFAEPASPRVEAAVSSHERDGG